LIGAVEHLDAGVLVLVVTKMRQVEKGRDAKYEAKQALE